MAENWPTDVVLTDAQFRAVIDRAIDLSDSSGTSLEDLRAVAAELGLNPDAVDRAVAEILAKDDPVGPPREFRDTARILRKLRALAAVQVGRDHVHAAILATAAVITPGDMAVVSLMLALPTIALYELTIRLVRVIKPKGNGQPPRSGSGVSEVTAAMQKSSRHHEDVSLRSSVQETLRVRATWIEYSVLSRAAKQSN